MTRRLRRRGAALRAAWIPAYAGRAVGYAKVSRGRGRDWRLRAAWIPAYAGRQPSPAASRLPSPRRRGRERRFAPHGFSPTRAGREDDGDGRAAPVHGACAPHGFPPTRAGNPHPPLRGCPLPEGEGGRGALRRMDSRLRGQGGRMMETGARRPFMALSRRLDSRLRGQGGRLHKGLLGQGRGPQVRMRSVGSRLRGQGGALGREKGGALPRRPCRRQGRVGGRRGRLVGRAGLGAAPNFRRAQERARGFLRAGRVLWV